MIKCEDLFNVNTLKFRDDVIKILSSNRSTKRNVTSRQITLPQILRPSNWNETRCLSKVQFVLSVSTQVIPSRWKHNLSLELHYLTLDQLEIQICDRSIVVLSTLEISIHTWNVDIRLQFMSGMSCSPTIHLKYIGILCLEISLNTNHSRTIHMWNFYILLNLVRNVNRSRTIYCRKLIFDLTWYYTHSSSMDSNALICTVSSETFKKFEFIILICNFPKNLCCLSVHL